MSIPKGSHVLPFGVCYGFWVREYDLVPKKELLRRVWVMTIWIFCVGGLGIVG